MTPSSATGGTRVRFLLWAALPVVLAAWLRLRNIGIPEPFVDEGANILTALDPRVRQAFEPLAQGRPWLVYAFAPVGVFPDHLLVVARLISATCGFITMAALGWTLHRLAGRVGALVGLWFWAVLPLAVFHERLALQDPMVTAALAVCTALLVTATRSTPPLWPRATWLAAGLCLGTPFMLKISALFALPWLVLLVIGSVNWQEKSSHWRLAGWFIVGSLLPVATLGTDVLQLGAHLGRYGALPDMSQAGPSSQLLHRVKTWLGWYAGYGGWPLALLFIAAMAARPSRPARFAAFGWALTLLISAALYQNGYARYALPDQLPLVLALALALGGPGVSGAARWTRIAVLTLAVGRWAWVASTIGSEPAKAAVPAAEIAQYYTGVWSGRGTAAVHDFLATHAGRTGTRCLVLTHAFLRPGCYALLLAERADPRIGVVPYTVYERSELATARLGLEHAAGTTPASFFLLYEGSLYPPPAWLDLPDSAARRVFTVDRGGGEAFVLYELGRKTP
jgi:4-amino-4-deoxy-L-arabinose transferase-like glycosyltransferase